MLLHFTSFADPCEIKANLMQRPILKAMVENPNCKITSVEQFLDRVPKAFFKNHVLMYRGRSLQGPFWTDYLNPRAIVFGEESDNIMMSFNGLPSQPAYNALEFVELDPSGGNDGKQFFRYFEIEFAPVPGTQHSVRVSQYNPPKCVTCHGSPARPIFAKYPTWAGAFGSSEEFLKADKGLEEIRNYEKFWASKTQHLRYAHLPKIYDGSGEANLFSSYASLRSAPESLENRLEKVDALRVVKAIQETPDYRSTRFALLGSLIGCQDWPSFFPPKLWSQMESNLQNFRPLKVKDIQAELDAIFSRTSDYRILPYPGPGVGSSQAQLRTHLGAQPFYLALQVDTLKVQGASHDDLRMAGVRFLMEGRGIPTENWFMDLAQPTYRQNNSSWVAPLLAQDSDLKIYEKAIEETDQMYGQLQRQTSPLCAELRQRSLAAFDYFYVANISPSETSQPGSYPRVFTQICARCHTDSVTTRVAPAIPFDSPNEMERMLRRSNLSLKIWRRVNAPEGNQMPPTRILTDQEINEIRSYLGM
jgi:cytochrome c553